ncbi:phosphatase PAP2 family protein [Leptolyngbya sp. BC1307]|uniref:phosphatase PAP2 family protein n=1 Tax=Leptolyngbya sp. BC1307 TaxID=2029589 RepID=UPI000EFAD0D0|nr:phosphatase PAP2 family protein [Leptolyngbya sp. BC1307]
MVRKSKTAVPAGVKAIAHRFWHESCSLPPAAWSRWWKTLAVGLGICALLTYLMTCLAMGWENTWLQAWDEKWLLILESRSPLSFPRSITWESPGNTIGMLPIFLILTALTAWFRQPIIAATAVVTYIGQFALVWISWGMWSRDRPELIANGIAAPGLHSFPSGHVVVVTTMYGLIFYLWFRTSRNWLERLIAIAFGTVWIGLIATARITLGAHWPSDIIVGLIVGALWLATVILALEKSDRIARNAKRHP